MDGITVPAPLQSKANQKLVRLNGGVQTGHEAIDGVEVIVQDVSSPSCSIELRDMGKLFFG